MRLSVVRLGVLLVPSCLLAAGAASAQVAPAGRSSPIADMRPQISIMEGILERAVNVGIHGAMQQMPDLFPGQIWVAPPRARGFRIEGYGVFFDVEVPGLPATVWSINVLARDNEIFVVNELNQMRALIAQAVPESKRLELTKSLDRVEARVSGAVLSEPGVPPRSGGAAAVNERVPAPPDRPSAPPPAMPPVRDPAAVYTTEVQKALVDVILRQAITVGVAPEEWFTIAASEARVGLGEPQTMTLYLSIKGKDLTALRTQQITPEEAAKRIVVKNY